MSWFDRAIKRGADKGVSDYLASPRFKATVDKVFSEVIEKVIRENPKIAFLLAMNAHFRRVCPTMTFRKAQNCAIETLREYLAEEKIKFGDPRYSWTADAAVTVARDYQTDHWEAVP